MSDIPNIDIFAQQGPPPEGFGAGNDKFETPSPVVEPNQPVSEPTSDPVDQGEDSSTPEDNGGKKSLKMEDFFKAKGEVAKDKPSDGVTPKVTEEPKVRPNQPQSVEKRDIEGLIKQYNLDPVKATVFKRMSNEAFEEVKGLLAERSKLSVDLETTRKEVGKTTIPATYYENPEAYVLHPEYLKTVKSADQITEQRNYWKQQFNAIRHGENWQDIVVDAQGKFQQIEREPSADAETSILAHLNGLDAQEREFRGKAEGIKQNFGNTHKQMVNAMRAREDMYFPEFKDHEVAMKNPYYSGMVKAIEEVGLKDNIFTLGYAKLYAKHMATVKENQELKKGSTKQAVIQNQHKQAGPTSGQINTGSTSQGKPNGNLLSMKDFNLAKERL